MATTPKAIREALDRANIEVEKTPNIVCNGMVHFLGAEHETAEGAARKIDYLARRVRELGEFYEGVLLEKSRRIRNGN